MPAIGFGQLVTGADVPGSTPTRFNVTRAGGDAAEVGTLPWAVAQANAAAGAPCEIVIQTNVDPNQTKLTITARNLTIRAEGNATIDSNNLVFNASLADNVILRDLRFTSDGVTKPNDCIKILAREGRGPKGFWIHHCYFRAYPDLSITTNTQDLPQAGADPLRITVSSCRFYDPDPNGDAHMDHGALGIHGFGDKEKNIRDLKTNAYATVCRNVFDHVRRRSPRSSQLTFVHAFNNLLMDWGTNDLDALQQNGMESGNFGLLVAQANYFEAGSVLKTAIEVAGGDEPARLTVGVGARVNEYANGATPAQKVGDRIAIQRRYQDGLGSGAVPPIPEPMSPQLRATILGEVPAAE